MRALRSESPARAIPGRDVRKGTRASVVISTHNRPARLEALLQALNRQTVAPDEFEVVLVDDGSGPATAEILQRELNRGKLALEVITRAVRRGPATARNQGWRAATAPVVAFTDDDCEPTPEWLEAGLRTAAEHNGAMIQGRTLPHPAELDRVGPFTRTLSVERAGPFYQTCNMLYPRSLLERLGGFDETFTAPGGEDTDLAWRALESGVEAVFAPDAVVYHAVEDLGPRGHLGVAMRWTDAMAMFRHPALRKEVFFLGVFWKRSHARLVAALLGAALASRFPPALLLGVPYGRHLRDRCRIRGASLALSPYFVVHDLLETYTAARGGIRHGVIVL